jgi:hypothetical protein
MTYSSWDERERSREEELLATYLSEQVTNRAAGILEDECVQNAPRDRYFIGNLRPVSPLDIDSTPQYLRDLVEKLSPMAFGAEFRAVSGDGKITATVTVSWNCYYRVFPTYDQQVARN